MKMLKKLLAVVLTGAMVLTLLTACGGNAVNDKNIADALNDIVKSSVAAGLTKDYTFKPRTDEQAMAKAIAALSEAEWNTKGDGGNKFSGPVMKILGLNEGGKNETSRFVWCGAVIADEIGTTGQAHNVINNILSQNAANSTQGSSSTKPLPPRCLPDTSPEKWPDRVPLPSSLASRKAALPIK